MTDASYSHKFMTALAESLGWNPEAVQKALTEIAQLQKQTQELELSVQGKAPTNHASKQGVFGLADEQMYGHVKVTHEVTNDSTAGVAVSPDAVYAYAPAKGMAAEMPISGDYLTSTVFTKYGAGKVALTKNGQLCVTNTIIFTAELPSGTNVSDLAFDNKLNSLIPCLMFWWYSNNVPVTPQPNQYTTHITSNGFLNSSGFVDSSSVLVVVITAGIYPIFAAPKE